MNLMRWSKLTILALLLSAGFAAGAAAQSTVSNADIQRLQDGISDASRDIAQARGRDAAGAGGCRAQQDSGRSNEGGDSEGGSEGGQGSQETTRGVGRAGEAQPAQHLDPASHEIEFEEAPQLAAGVAYQVHDAVGFTLGGEDDIVRPDVGFERVVKAHPVSNLVRTRVAKSR